MDISHATWRTHRADGTAVELPATIDAIRAALPAGRRGAFAAEVGAAPADQLPQLLARWAVDTDPAVAAETDADIARVAAGDMSGCVVLDDGEAGAA